MCKADIAWGSLKVSVSRMIASLPVSGLTRAEWQQAIGLDSIVILHLGQQNNIIEGHP